MTLEELQQVIAANTIVIPGVNESLNFLVTEFIRPNAQQHLQSLERIDRLEEILDLHNQAVIQIDERLDRVATLATSNAEALAQFDKKLEETRQLVAENGSQIAQLSVKQDRNSDLIAQNAEAIDVMVRESTAFRESQRNQLAAIIGNGRRIDRLEQQTS